MSNSKNKKSCIVCGKMYSSDNITIHLRRHEEKGENVDWIAHKKLGSLNCAKSALGNKRGKGNKGKKHSLEQKENHSKIMTGRKQSLSSKIKRSESLRKYWQSVTPERMSELRISSQKDIFKPTSLELKVQDWLEREKIIYVIHPWIYAYDNSIRRIYRPDIGIVGTNLVVEVQGCYWHGCMDCYGDKALKNRIEEDKKRKILMKSVGLQVCEIWQHNIENHEIGDIMNKSFENCKSDSRWLGFLDYDRVSPVYPIAPKYKVIDQSPYI